MFHRRTGMRRLARFLAVVLPLAGGLGTGQPAGAAEETDRFRLAADDPCFDTVESYKQYMTPLIEDLSRTHSFRKYEWHILSSEQCCPGGAAEVKRTRFEKDVPDSVDYLPLPPVFKAGYSLCSAAIDSDMGREWRHNLHKKRSSYWDGIHAGLRDRLYRCCVEQFQTCLNEASRTGPDGEPLVSASASSLCAKRFSPEQQPAAAETGSGAAPEEDAGKGVSGRYWVGAVIVLLQGLVFPLQGSASRWVKVAFSVGNAATAWAVYHSLVVWLGAWDSGGLLFLSVVVAIAAALLLSLLASLFLPSRRRA